MKEHEFRLNMSIWSNALSRCCCCLQIQLPIWRPQHFLSYHLIWVPFFWWISSFQYGFKVVLSYRNQDVQKKPFTLIIIFLCRRTWRKKMCFAKTVWLVWFWILIFLFQYQDWMPRLRTWSWTCSGVAPVPWTVGSSSTPVWTPPGIVDA